MIRKPFGLLLVLHGLAHALPGMRVTDATRWDAAGSGALLWVATALWATAAAGLVAAGLGALGATPFRRCWRAAGRLGAGASIVLLAAFWRTPWALPGLAVDLAALWLLLRPVDEAPAPEPGDRGPRRALHRTGAAGLVLLVGYLALLILARPWHMRWGSTGAELRRPLPGDETAAVPNFQIQHAVEIAAPPAEVWPWLAQIGHDRGGFYSYSRLENAFGLHVRNADRVHPEWQDVAAGDSVLSTPDDYLGLGRRFGWRVARAEPGRVLVLERWGAFVLEPAGAGTTRLVVRTRGGGEDDLAALALAPLGLLVLEPAHFVMERRMLLGIKERVEAARAGRGRS
ncbi:MAG TPA: hypothetical protein VF263_13610 [Longimicrobiaceae bacterium]